MKILKQIEWDMGHRITNHHSQCRNLHGHRYRAEIWVEGKLIHNETVSEEGMVIDFGDVKKIAMEYIHDILDHGFMVWSRDKILIDFFKKNSDLKYIIVPFVPTSENIAAWIFVQMDKNLKDKYRTGLKLHSIKLWETPTSAAECSRKDIKYVRGI